MPLALVCKFSTPLFVGTLYNIPYDILNMERFCLIFALVPVAVASPKSLPRNKQISKDPIIEPTSSESLNDVGGGSTASEEENGIGYVVVLL